VRPWLTSEAGEAWAAAERTNSIAAFEAYAARYKDSYYADLARARIEVLKKEQPDAAASAWPCCRRTTPRLAPARRRAQQPSATVRIARRWWRCRPVNS
jgi:hypothetical protein